MKTTAKDYVHKWKRRYEAKTGSKLIINYLKDCSHFKKLMATYTKRELHDIIDFAFSDHQSTSYLKENGYPIPLFCNQVNRFHLLIKSPEIEIPFKELDLSLDVHNDNRTEYIIAKIEQGDLTSLICHITDVYNWTILFGKMRHSLGFIPLKVTIFYDRWTQKDDFDRQSIKRDS